MNDAQHPRFTGRRFAPPVNSENVRRQLRWRDVKGKGLRSRLTAIGDWPTGKVKGALVLAIVGGGAFWLRGHMEPHPNPPSETLTTNTVARTRSLQVEVNALFDSTTDLDLLDAETHVVDANRRFYLRRPKVRNLRTIQHEEPEVFDGLSVAMMPFFRHLLGAVDDLVSTDQPRPGDVATTRLLAGEELRVEFSEQTRIGKAPLFYNPLDGSALEQRSSSLWLNLIGEDEETWSHELRSLLGSTGSLSEQDLVKKSIDSAIRSRVPTGAKVQQGLTVRSLRKSWLLSSPFGRARLGEPSTFTYFFLLQMLNPEMAIIALNHIDVSQNNAAVLFDSSFPLRNVTVSGRARESVEVVKVFLLVEGREFVHVVRLEYLDGFLGRRNENEMEDAFGSFRVSTR